MKNKRKSETAVLEDYRVALENVNAQEQIASAMVEIGYDDAIIAEGRSLLEETLKNYQGNKAEAAERSDSYDSFIHLWDELVDIYSTHRKKAKVVFRNKHAILEQLRVNTSAPSTFVGWIQVVKSFYEELSKDEELQKGVARLNFTISDITSSLLKLEKLEKARADYMKEKGESQNATQLKDESFRNLDRWMSDFFAVARIALEDNPQLLEALSKTIKN